MLGLCPCWPCWGHGVSVLRVLEPWRVQIGRVGAVLEPGRVRVGRVVLATVFGSSCRVSQFGVRVNPQGVVSCCIFRVLVSVSCWGRP